MKLINDSRTVQQIRQQRAEQQAQQQQLAAALDVAKAAGDGGKAIKALSDAGNQAAA